MVHALEKAQQWLEPDGVLISIQPLGVPPTIEFHTEGEVTVIGEIQHKLNHANQKYALKAIAETIENGFFSKERETEFDFLSHAASIEALRDHLVEFSENMFIDDETILKAEDFSSEFDEVIRRERVKLTVLRPIDLSPPTRR